MTVFSLNNSLFFWKFHIKYDANSGINEIFKRKTVLCYIGKLANRVFKQFVMHNYKPKEPGLHLFKREDYERLSDFNAGDRQN